MTRRNLYHYLRVPALVAVALAQAVLFVVMFTYVFQGAIDTPGIRYVDYLMPGILLLAVAFGSPNTGVGLAEDLTTGMLDRFRALPMARPALLAGRTLADAVRNLVVVLVMLGVGALIGSFLGGRLGDTRPYSTTIIASAATGVILLGICVVSKYTLPTVVLIGLLGLTSMTVNPILIALEVRFADRAPTLASALSTSAFNLGTAVGSWIAGRALDSSLGELGPPVTGTVIAALTLVPLSVLALTRLSRAEANTNHDRQTFDNDEANGLRVSSH